MTDDAIMKFILLVEVHFPRPKFNGDERREAVWMRSMREILSEFEPDILAEAAERIIRNRNPKHGDSTTFPKPAECIEACERIKAQRRFYEQQSEFERDEPVRRLEAIAQSMPVFEIRRHDLRWRQWIDYFESIGRKDLAGEAETRGVIKASKKWPSSDAVVFEPPLQSADLLARLPSPREMPS